MSPKTLARVAATSLALAALPATAGAADRGTTTLNLSLASAGVKTAAVWPAKLSRSGALTLPITQVTPGPTTVVRHEGAIRLARGTRKVTLTSVQLHVGAQTRISALLGGRRTTVFTVRGSSLSVTRAAARRLRSALRLRTLPTRAGRATMTAPSTSAPSTSAPVPAPAPAPAPAAPAPAPAPGEIPVSTAGTQWISSTLPGSSDHKSWINYVTNAAWISGSVTPLDGAARIAVGNKYDYTLTPTTVSRALGVTTLNHRGKLQYRVPLHSIDQSIQNLTFRITPLTGSGEVIADGQANDRDFIGAPPVPFLRTKVLDLRLAGIVPAVAPNGDVTYANVPATIAEGAEEEVGYEAGRPWGSFTFTIPAS